ncbi:Eukaryotic translation initiation factor 5A [Pelomyxa schiedti]|nr:Eukaryotic translation initiation factor 5A [Pelomyxa schiedti]
MSTFQESQSGETVGSDVFPVQCSALRKGGFVVLKNAPCKIMEMRTSKTGKHGHAKVHLVGIDIFTGRKYEDLCPSTHNMDVPEVKRADYDLIDIEDKAVSLLTDTGDIKDDVLLPEGELGESISAAFAEGQNLTVTCQKAMGIEQIISFKVDN